MEKFARFKWPVILILIGLALDLCFFVSFTGLLRDTGTSFLGPGESTVTITKPGDYTLWRSTSAILDGQFMTFPDDLPTGTSVKILKLPEGTVVPLHGNGESSVQSGQTRRVSIGQITFSSPGDYKVVVSGLAVKRAFYLDQPKFLKVLLIFFGCGMAGGLVLFAGVGWALFTLSQIRRQKPTGANAPITLGSVSSGPSSSHSHNAMDAPPEATLALSFPKALYYSAGHMMLFFAAGFVLIGWSEEERPFLVALSIMSVAMTFVFAGALLTMLRCKFGLDGLCSGAPGFFTHELTWEDISKVRKPFGAPFYVVEGRGLFSRFCIVPSGLLLKNPDRLKQLVEQYAPADNILRRELAR